MRENKNVFFSNLAKVSSVGGQKKKLNFLEILLLKLASCVQTGLFYKNCKKTTEPQALPQEPRFTGDPHRFCFSFSS